MRVTIAGATGVLGRAAIPVFTGAGHEVRGLARHPSPGDESMVAIDILDRESLVGFAREWRPEALVHLATAIPSDLKPWGVAKQFAATNRLRTEGTRNLLAAAEAAGCERFAAQSIAFAVAPGDGLADEGAPLWTDGQMGEIVSVVAELERLTADVGGAVLRYGQLHGPGTIFAADGTMGKAAARGMLPIVHRGGHVSTFSFTHPHDAATATLAAVERDATGVFNVVDDEPVETSEWIPALARERGAKREPRRVPAWLARPLAGSYGVTFMTELRGADNAKAKRELGWAPSIGWREGFAQG
jgi:nucleoside-diphosphate-sugar epimerase